jgi:fatty-acyl-CoA synthase
VIIRGSHNIDPALVEDAFLAHPAVAMCAVVAEPDAYAGEVPVAFVTLKPGAQVAPEDLLAAVAPTVYERPAVPKRVVLLDALPVTAIGKVFKPELRLRAIEIKLREALRDWAPGVNASVSAFEQGGRQRTVIELPGPRDTALHERLLHGLAAMAVDVDIRFS